ncbi:MAG: plasmid partitioning protein RepB, partial [Beijerinckiaceae bacterium]
MSKPPRRSIVSAFSALSNEASAAVSSAAPEQKSGDILRVSGQPRVGAGVIGATQRTIADIREERDRLLKQVEAGGFREVDPALVDPSPFPDRLPDDDAAAFDALKQSMAAEGQKVPVELRRSPLAAGRFQVVYGHRRWRAARELGVSLKAIVSDLSDRDMALAQGLENASRQDLSWIEKALFADAMERASVKARDIRGALAVDDAELARFRQVCRGLGAARLRLIGRAPKAGRPRWMELAAAVSAQPGLLAEIDRTLATAKDQHSDLRFTRSLALAAPARVSA